MYAHPHITTLDKSLLPAAPAGYKFDNLVDPDGVAGDLKHYPVLLFGAYTYTALSDVDNYYRMLIVAWDMQRNLVKRWEKSGARYLWRITFDSAAQRVTFSGQSSQSVHATLDELVVGPSVILLPPSSGPVLPYTLAYDAIVPSQFPVIKSGPYSFWPVSYKDGRNSFCVVVVDRENVIQRLVDCPGGRVIQDVQVNNADRTIVLHGRDGSVAAFDYKTALACYWYSYNITKDDFLFLAGYFNVSLSDADATALAEAMPQIDCALCCRMKGTYTEESERVKRSPGGIIIGSLLGGIIGGMGGFLIGGPLGIGFGFLAGSAAGAGIGQTIPSSSDTGQYQLSSLEKDHSLVGYRKFPSGPFDNTGVRENIFDSPFPRYQELVYSAAVVRLDGASSPQAYSPKNQSIGPFPRDPRYSPLPLSNGMKLAKYIFVIVKTDETVNGEPGYQMRINPEDFYPASWLATNRVNHSQLSEGYRFWALLGHPHMQVYAAGSLYVDIVNQKLLATDTRTGHYFASFQGHDQEVTDATVGFLANLGYHVSDLLSYTDISMYLQENRA